ncbi:MAG: hypothetical protein EBW12_07645 [Actinobacteria bacterium]|nr:hypothetical protein [Actinomycetota bacterium]
MKRSEPCDAISAALAAAQAEMKNPSFDSTNPHFRNKFASLAAIRNAVVPVFAKHGLSVMQELTSGEDTVACLTVVQHSSGQWLEFGPLAMPVSKPDAQGYGSASTYCKRYSLQSVAAIVGDEDDDGNEASKPTQKPAKAAKPDKWVLEQIGMCESVEKLQTLYKSLDEEKRAACLEAFAARRKELGE